MNVPMTVMDPEQKDDGPGQEHILGDQGLQQKGTDRGQAQHQRYDDAPGHHEGRR